MTDNNKNQMLQRSLRDNQNDMGYCAGTERFMNKFYGVDSYCPSNENFRQLNRVPRPDHSIYGSGLAFSD